MFDLEQCEKTLLREIRDKKMKRKDVAKTYRLALMSTEFSSVNWGRVNKAIIRRWSVSALGYIKKLAWSAGEI